MANGPVLVKLATVVEGDPKAPFLIATTPRFLSLDCSILPLIRTLSDSYKQTRTPSVGRKYWSFNAIKFIKSDFGLVLMTYQPL